jgi:hypothetical protein
MSDSFGPESRHYSQIEIDKGHYFVVWSIGTSYIPFEMARSEDSVSAFKNCYGMPVNDKKGKRN